MIATFAMPFDLLAEIAEAEDERAWRSSSAIAGLNGAPDFNPLWIEQVDGQTQVSGTPIRVMRFIGAVAEHVVGVAQQHEKR